MGLLDFFGTLLGRKTDDALGPRGEREAARYVRRVLKYKVLRRNVRCPGGELDIVALDGRDLVFIEVRTRSSEDFGTPEGTIRGQKRERIIHAARWYIRTHRLRELNPRFDTIAVVWPAEGKPTIRHRRCAFSMSGR